MEKELNCDLECQDQPLFLNIFIAEILACVRGGYLAAKLDGGQLLPSQLMLLLGQHR